MPDNKEILTKAEEIEILSEEVEEIFGQIPKRIVRWGITIVFILVVMIIIGSFVFKYPDVIHSSIIIVSKNPPAAVVAYSSGKIDYLLVQNKDHVRINQILAILENTADHNHVTEVKNKLDSLTEIFINNKLPPTKLPTNYNLGPIQTAYSSFYKNYKEYVSFITINQIEKKINAISQQIKDYSKYTDKISKQIENKEITLQLSYNQYQRDSSLFSNQIISIADFEKSQQSYIQEKNNLQNLQASFVNTQMLINQLNYQIIDLQSQRTDQNQSLINSLKESYDNLKATIANWEKQYLLISSVDGIVTFNKFWSTNQFVMSGEVVFTIVPEKPQQIVGRTKLPVSGSGKVRVGQKVLIKLDNFPYMEFGLIEGQVENIALVPEYTNEGTFYNVDIVLPNGLLTTYNKDLPFNQEMQGEAEIITKNMSVFSRFIQPIRAAVSKQQSSSFE